VIQKNDFKHFFVLDFARLFYYNKEHLPEDVRPSGKQNQFEKNF
jgi:hypothetical protein